MKEVLLISNLDLQSPDVLMYVAEFCRYQECELHIIHFDESVDPVLISTPQSYARLGIDVHSTERRADLIKKIRESTTSFIDWVNVTIKGENETWFIDKFIAENHLDLLILGQNIFTKYHDSIGNNIKEVITRHTMVPMMVLPPLEIFKPIESINYLLKDLNDHNLQHISSLSTMFPKADINLTHIVEHSRDELDKVSSLRWMTYINKLVSDRISLQSESIAYSKYLNLENNAITQIYDLLVFSTYNRNFWDRILDPSTTLRQLSALHIPAMIFKHTK